MMHADSPADRALPAVRRPEFAPERVLYVARAGLGALPSGFGTLLLFMALPGFTLMFFLWAIWWPYPTTTAGLTWSIVVSSLLGLSVIGTIWGLTRASPGLATAILRAPFIRITVTDRRLVWTVPWTNEPLIEIGRGRMLRGIVGMVDERGRGNAAIELVPGDPAADTDGHIHFDRLPHVASFVRALSA